MLTLFFNLSIEFSSQVIQVVNKRYAIFLQSKEGNIQINVELPNNFTVEDCLHYSVDIFNK